MSSFAHIWFKTTLLSPAISQSVQSSRRSALQTAWLVLLPWVTCEPMYSFTFLFNIPLDVFPHPLFCLNSLRMMKKPLTKAVSYSSGFYGICRSKCSLSLPSHLLVLQFLQSFPCLWLFSVRMNMFKPLCSWKCCVCSETRNQAKVLHWESWSQVFPRAA